MRFKELCSILIVALCLVLLWNSQVLSLEVPEFVFRTPKNHYSGISEPSGSLASARRSAIQDVVRQIISSIGERVDYSSFHSAYGNPKYPSKSFKDSITRQSKGFVSDVERNIIDSAISMEGSKYVYFVLVRYDSTLLGRMRVLSAGAKVSGKILSLSKGKAIIRISEINGVSVVIDKALVNIKKRHRFAKTISYFVMKVPDGESSQYRVGIGPVNLKKSSETLSVPLSFKGATDYLLGSEYSIELILSGTDEVGRVVEVRL